MPWILAAVPVAAAALIQVASGSIHAGVVGYHAVCAVLIVRRRASGRSARRP